MYITRYMSLCGCGLCAGFPEPLVGQHPHSLYYVQTLYVMLTIGIIIGLALLALSWAFGFLGKFISHIKDWANYFFESKRRNLTKEQRKQIRLEYITLGHYISLGILGVFILLCVIDLITRII